MRPHWIIAPLVVLAVVLSACRPAAGRPQDSGGEDPTTATYSARAEVTVVATMSILADFAAVVGGPFVNVRSIVPVGGDPHTYEPTPADAIALSDADVVFDNGLGLSPWFEPLRTNVGGDLVVVTDALAAEVRRTDGRLDPHMWMVPPFVADGYISAIADALVDVDPDHTATYLANAAAYRQTLAELDRELVSTLDAIPSQNRKIVTSHDAYSYFADHYDLDVVGTITGVSTEEEPSAQSVAALIDRIRSESVPAVFFETTINSALAERVAADAGVLLGDPLYGDSVGGPGSGAEDYRGMMHANANALVAALARSS